LLCTFLFTVTCRLWRSSSAILTYKPRVLAWRTYEGLTRPIFIKSHVGFTCYHYEAVGLKRGNIKVFTFQHVQLFCQRTPVLRTDAIFAATDQKCHTYEYYRFNLLSFYLPNASFTYYFVIKFARLFIKDINQDVSCAKAKYEYRISEIFKCEGFLWNRVDDMVEFKSH